MVKSAAKTTYITAQPALPMVDESAAYQPSDNDIIDDILCAVIALAPQFSVALANQVSKDMRDKWGGDRPYIARRVGQGYSQRNANIKRDYLAGAHMHLLERRYGLCRARLWVIIKS